MTFHVILNVFIIKRNNYDILFFNRYPVLLDFFRPFTRADQ